MCARTHTHTHTHTPLLLYDTPLCLFRFFWLHLLKEESVEQISRGGIRLKVWNNCPEGDPIPQEIWSPGAGGTNLQRGDQIPWEICSPEPNFLGNLVTGAVGTNLQRGSDSPGNKVPGIKFPREFGPPDWIPWSHSSGEFYPWDQISSDSLVKLAIACIDQQSIIPTINQQSHASISDLQCTIHWSAGPMHQLAIYQPPISGSMRQSVTYQPSIYEQSISGRTRIHCIIQYEWVSSYKPHPPHKATRTRVFSPDAMENLRILKGKKYNKRLSCSTQLVLLSLIRFPVPVGYIPVLNSQPREVEVKLLYELNLHQLWLNSYQRG